MYTKIKFLIVITSSFLFLSTVIANSEKNILAKHLGDTCLSAGFVSEDQCASKVEITTLQKIKEELNAAIKTLNRSLSMLTNIDHKEELPIEKALSIVDIVPTPSKEKSIPEQPVDQKNDKGSGEESNINTICNALAQNIGMLAQIPENRKVEFAPCCKLDAFKNARTKTGKPLGELICGSSK